MCQPRSEGQALAQLPQVRPYCPVRVVDAKHDERSGYGQTSCTIVVLLDIYVSRVLSWFGGMVAAATPKTRRAHMLYWAAIFFVIALIAGIFGFMGLAATAAGAAKILFFVFLILAIVSFVFGRRMPT